VRDERKTDTWFKRSTALFFYRFVKLLGVEIIHNHSDYRLTSNRVLEHLKSFGEVNLFLRGIFPLIGFKHSCVYYNRLERTAGETKYTLSKMISFAFDGLSSFSVKPLRMVSVVGIIIFFISILLTLYVVYSYLIHSNIPGWASIALPIYFFSGVQILCIGIIGEYLGKIYNEVKKRPRYIIESTLKQ
jgi:glycosyltransferase involved in cell wall biosynthesis